MTAHRRTETGHSSSVSQTGEFRTAENLICSIESNKEPKYTLCACWYAYDICTWRKRQILPHKESAPARSTNWENSSWRARFFSVFDLNVRAVHQFTSCTLRGFRPVLSDWPKGQCMEPLHTILCVRARHRAHSKQSLSNRS